MSVFTLNLGFSYQFFCQFHMLNSFVDSYSRLSLQMLRIIKSLEKVRDQTGQTLPVAGICEPMHMERAVSALLFSCPNIIQQQLEILRWLLANYYKHILFSTLPEWYLLCDWNSLTQITHGN